ncbi:hypothetical protein [Pararhizobium sp.]|uniref:hypothetical protein n=1 Tax=Pararhizobium sp. TaxID=1977563 RepID=UPI002724182C|nr:hypothetical protein [Pararhizobium sp.]MDO9417032.1 hypothetical protein [Pararhizobium sp.]
MIDVAIAIDGEAITVTRTRRAEGTYNANGDGVPGASTTEAIRAAIQPAKGNQLMDMPEGVRTEAGWIAWSRSEMAVDDVITSKGVNYRVLFDWPRDEGSFYRAALGKVKS